MRSDESANTGSGFRKVWTLERARLDGPPTSGQVWTDRNTCVGCGGFSVVARSMPSGFSVWAGNFNELDFGEGFIASNGGLDGYVRKYDPWGNLMWQKVLRGSGDERVYGVEADSDGAVFVYGTFSAPFTVDTLGVSPVSTWSSFIVKLAP